jgi:hypothetical protein
MYDISRLRVNTVSFVKLTGFLAVSTSGSRTGADTVVRIFLVRSQIRISTPKT